MLWAASHAPVGKQTLTNILLRLCSDDEITPSVYGPFLQTRKGDLTFKFCVTGAYGRYLSDLLSAYSKPFSFIDIGANIGLYSLIAASNPACQSCHAFEPNPEVFASFERNIALNGHLKVHAYNAAVSSEEGQLRFAAPAGHSGAGALQQEGTMTVASVNRHAFDAIAAADTFPKIVKIDVEGHEPVVITELLNSSIAPQIRNLYFEVQESRYEIGSITSTLQAAGFAQTFKNEAGEFYDLMFERG
jgi:FkbM family methyltransferase